MERHRDDLAGFLVGDPRGAKLVPYLRMLADVLADAPARARDEVRLLQEHVDKTKAVISKQEVHAGPKLVLQRCDVRHLVGDAVAVVAPTYAEHGIELVQVHGEVPEVSVESPSVVQILLNLLRNAGDAVIEAGPKGTGPSCRLAATATPASASSWPTTGSASRESTSSSSSRRASPPARAGAASGCMTRSCRPARWTGSSAAPARARVRRRLHARAFPL